MTHTGSGTTWIGEYGRGGDSPRCREIRRVFNHAGLPTRVSDDIQSVIWTKAIMNSAINPVSALVGLPNGELAQSKSLRQITKVTIAEGCRVAKAEGVRLKSPDALLAFTIDVLRKTAKNRSSMLQDIEARRRTEIRELNGSIVRYASRHRLDCPLNNILVELVTNLERTSRAPRD